MHSFLFFGKESWLKDPYLFCPLWRVVCIVVVAVLVAEPWVQESWRNSSENVLVFIKRSPLHAWDTDPSLSQSRNDASSTRWRKSGDLFPQLQGLSIQSSVNVFSARTYYILAAMLGRGLLRLPSFIHMTTYCVLGTLWGLGQLGDWDRNHVVEQGGSLMLSVGKQTTLKSKKRRKLSTWFCWVLFFF